MVSSAAAVSLASQLDSVDSAAAVEDDFARTRLIQAARSLVARIEKPWEGLFRIAWQEVSSNESPYAVTDENGLYAKNDYIAMLFGRAEGRR